MRKKYLFVLANIYFELQIETFIEISLGEEIFWIEDDQLIINKRTRSRFLKIFMNKILIQDKLYLERGNI